MFDFTPPAGADALAIIQRLQSAGFTAYLAGGCVRDGLLGREPKDFDVATDATPDTVRELFGRRRTLAFGASFGVIGVLGTAPEPTEVATFRHDGTYSDGRRPDHVRFGTAEEDAVRRDFTINGLFYDPLDDRVIDYVHGRADLAKRLVRAIGDPEARIGEDKLRMLRAVRFAANLGFSLDPQTARAIRTSAHEVTVTSRERVGAEMRRMLGTVGAAEALQLMADTGLMEPVWPEIDPGADSFSTVKALAAAIQPPQFAACVAAVLIVAAADPESHVDAISQRWKWSVAEQKAVVEAIRHWKTVFEADRRPWSVVQPVLMLPHREAILTVAEAWALVHDLPDEGIALCRHRLASWPSERLDPPPLLTGQSLIALGYRPGPRFKEVLAQVRRDQLDGKLVTEEEATAVARRTLDAG